MKTDLKNPINGLGPTNMLGIGWTIKSMVLEFNIIPMGTNTKVDGVKTKDMVRVLSGLQIPKTNLEDNTQEIGKTTPSKEEEQCFINRAIDMTVCGWITCHMGRVG